MCTLNCDKSCNDDDDGGGEDDDKLAKHVWMQVLEIAAKHSGLADDQQDHTGSFAKLGVRMLA